MMPYLLLTILALTGFFGHDLRRDAPARPWRIILWGMTFAVIVMDTLRYHVGLDTYALHEHILYFPTAELIKGEPTYLPAYRIEFLYSLLRPIGPLGACAIVNASYAILFNVPFTLFISRYTRYWFGAYMIYFCVLFTTFNFEIVRQSAAAGIFLWAWNDLLTKNWKKFFPKILLATFFHLSAIALMLLPPLLTSGARRKLTDPRFIIPLMCALFLLTLNLSGLKPIFESAMQLASPDSSLWLLLGRARDSFERNPFPDLNWKGWAGHILIYLIYPLILMSVLKKYGKGEFSRAAATLCALYAAIGSIGIIYEPIARFRFYILPVIIVATANSLYLMGRSISLGLKKHSPANSILPLGGLACFSLWIIFHLNSYRAPIALVNAGHCYDKYIPYLNLAEGKECEYRDSLVGAYHKRTQPYEFLENSSLGNHKYPDTNEKGKQDK